MARTRRISIDEPLKDEGIKKERKSHKKNDKKLNSMFTKHIGLERAQKKLNQYYFPCASKVTFDIYSDVAKRLFPSWHVEDMREETKFKKRIFTATLVSDEIKMGDDEQIIFYVPRGGKKQVVKEALITRRTDFAPRMVTTQCELPAENNAHFRKAALNH